MGHGKSRLSLQPWVFRWWRGLWAHRNTHGWRLSLRRILLLDNPLLVALSFCAKGSLHVLQEDEFFTCDKFQMDVPNCSGWVCFPWLVTEAPEGQRACQGKDKLSSRMMTSPRQMVQAYCDNVLITLFMYNLSEPTTTAQLQCRIYTNCKYIFERFSNECRKIKTKAIITMANHNKCKRQNEPMETLSKYR